MCGLAGIIGSKSTKNQVLKMLEVTNHRGPDDSGIFSITDVNIGMNRLAIQDLSTAGHQPMISRCGRFVMIYNGEVYNFKALRNSLIIRGYEFKSNSDTEVLLALFTLDGIDTLLKKIRGMFAFVIWDNIEQSAIAVRDHFGIKPFYYSFVDGQFVFSSELKAFKYAPISLSINPNTVYKYLIYGYVPQPLTIYDEIHCLLPGELIRLENGEITKETYWKFNEGPKIIIPSLEEAITHTKALVVDSVKEQVISDVPLGVFLSGGLDSTILVAAMRDVGVHDIKTFTVGFDHLGASIDETEKARETAEFYQTEHYNLLIQRKDINGLLGEYLKTIDQPSVDGFNTFIVSKFAKQEVTVALSGLGADESFGGYNTFRDIILRSRSSLFSFPFSLIKSFPDFIPERVYHKLKTLIAGKNVPAYFSQLWRYNNSNDLKRLFKDQIYTRGKFDFEMYHLFSSLVNQDVKPFQSITELYYRTWMGSRLLRDSDVFSMGHSLELRVPYLDKRLVEFAYQIPTEYHFSQLNSAQGTHYGKQEVKRVLKRAFHKDLPTNFDKRQKSGFNLPIDNWMKTVLKPIVYEYILASNELFNRKVLESRLKGWEEGIVSWRHIWSLFIFAYWYKENNVQ